MKSAPKNRQANQNDRTVFDQGKLETALDDLIRTFEDVNRKLDELVAEAKG